MRDFGAIGDNSTDDTEAFTAALDAAEAQANGSRPYGSVVSVPEGEYFVDQIRMRSQVTLAGYGPSTIIRKNSGIATPLVVLDKDTTNFTVLRDLRLRGNRYGGGGQGVAHGIFYQNSEDGNEIKQAERFAFHADGQHRISNVTVDAVDGNGVHIFARETHIDHCLIGDITKNGLVLDGSDNWVTNTSINWTGHSGVVVNGGNNYLSGVKCWYIGTDTSYEEADAFLIVASRQTLTGCMAQDISRYGLNLKGADNCIVSSMMLDNIGNFHVSQNQGFDHPPLSGAVMLFKQSGLTTYNSISVALAQRSANLTNINAFVHFGDGSQNNSATISGDYGANTLTNQPITRSGDISAYNNFAIVNGRVA
ncbi:MAG: glycosyl hydrolase family 28-related protein [Geminicoccaceae bacterium]